MKPFGKKRGMGRFLLKAAVLCASFAAVFLVTYWLNQSYLARTAATARVVTASRPLLPGEKLEREDLTLADRDRLPAVVVVVLDAAEEERAKALVRYNEEGRLYFSPTKSPE